MQIFDTHLPDVKLIQPKRYNDSRGWFAEFFNGDVFEKAGLPTRFVQDNQSFSTHGVLRGLHYQVEQQQGKLVRALSGHIWDVAVDLRQDSDTFGKWQGFSLKSEEGTMLWLPEGFAHGFLAMSDGAEVLYKTTALYKPSAERCVRWNDPRLAIEWPLETLTTGPIISGKDDGGALLEDAELPPVLQRSFRRS